MLIETDFVPELEARLPLQVALELADALHDADVKYDPEQKEGRLAMFENDFVGTCGRMSASMFAKDADPALVERVTSDMCDGSPEVGTTLIGDFLDYDLGRALSTLYEQTGTVVEPSGAAALAVALRGDLRGRVGRAGVLLSGGNSATEMLNQLVCQYAPWTPPG